MAGGRAFVVVEHPRRWTPFSVHADVASTKAETPIFWATVKHHFPKVGSGGLSMLQATEPKPSYERPGFVAEYQGGDPVPVAYLPDPGPSWL